MLVALAVLCWLVMDILAELRITVTSSSLLLSQVITGAGSACTVQVNVSTLNSSTTFAPIRLKEGGATI